MAGLSLREEVSRSSEVEIALLLMAETRARFAELFQNGKTLSGVFLTWDRRHGKARAPPRPTRPLS